MHELSLCHSIADIVDEARGGREVVTVNLRIGQLRQVVPETLTYCWDLVTADGPLAGSALAIDHIPVTLACRDCGELTTVEHALMLTCGSCRSGAIDLRSGEEFEITSVDVRRESEGNCAS